MQPRALMRWSGLRVRIRSPLLLGHRKRTRSLSGGYVPCATKLDRTLIWNQRQLRHLLAEYVAHYNQHRPHRSLDQDPPSGSTVTDIGCSRRVTRRAVCGGLINEYRPAA